ncbi:tyrosine-type recombinase/integrase, partial [Salmonella enterica]|nr:tyrosine-type recombinase/integrase [Salmonella enterica]
MKRKYLTQEEIEKLLSATDRMPFPERNRCLILMAFIHGFRASELLGLRCRILILQEDSFISGASKMAFQRVTPSFPMSIT